MERKIIMNEIKTNMGFNGDIFLTKSEWETYRKRMPVRYIMKKKIELCEICGKHETNDNPFQNSHIIGFKIGIVYLGLTPEYVDGHENIVCAHRKNCNSKAELNLMESCKQLKLKGIKSLPSYLPDFVHETWKQA
jgi:hypothetical protein